MHYPHKSKLMERAMLIGALTALSWGIAQAAGESPITEAFKKLDSDGDGFIAAQEAKAAGMSLEAFQSADRDRDGKLGPEEFAATLADKASGQKQP